MIVDVHTHLPSHMETVPPDDMVIDTVMRSGESVQMTNSIDDYLRDMGPVDKAFIFGIIICVVSAFEGFRTQGGAEGVGRATTAAVVNSFLLVIAADCVFTALFYFVWT